MKKGGKRKGAGRKKIKGARVSLTLTVDPKSPGRWRKRANAMKMNISRYVEAFLNGEIDR